jgi:hypothetical protein
VERELHHRRPPVCAYRADGEDAIREHGRRGGFPVDGVYEVTGAFDPTTAAATVGVVSAGAVAAGVAAHTH